MSIVLSREITLLMLFSVWMNGFAQHRLREEVFDLMNEDLDAFATEWEVLDFYTPDFRLRPSALSSNDNELENFGLRFQPANDENVYLLYEYNFNEKACAEIGLSVSNFKALTLKYSHAFSLWLIKN